MRNLVSTYVEQFRQDRQKQLKLVAVLAALAVIVAGVVFWQLHNTGVAMSNEVYCGMEEHTHDDSCYEQVLICGIDEEDHVHDDSCYETVLTCEIPEHTHTVECLADETADVETADVWEETLPSMTGIWSQDVAAVAESQVGYTESGINYILAEDGTTHQGYNRYGAWYGNDYGDWDAMFASFCLNYAGIPEEEFPEASGAYAWTADLAELGLYIEDESFIPEKGDLIFFDEDQDGAVDRVGVISNIDNEEDTITVIEGNSNDAVEENVYDAADNLIMGFGLLPEQDLGGETVYTIEYDSDEPEYVEISGPEAVLEDEDLTFYVTVDLNSGYDIAEATANGEEMMPKSITASEDGQIYTYEYTVENVDENMAVFLAAKQVIDGEGTIGVYEKADSYGDIPDYTLTVSNVPTNTKISLDSPHITTDLKRTDIALSGNLKYISLPDSADEIPVAYLMLDEDNTAIEGTYIVTPYDEDGDALDMETGILIIDTGKLVTAVVDIMPIQTDTLCYLDEEKKNDDYDGYTQELIGAKATSASPQSFTTVGNDGDIVSLSDLTGKDEFYYGTLGDDASGLYPCTDAKIVEVSDQSTGETSYTLQPLNPGSGEPVPDTDIYMVDDRLYSFDVEVTDVVNEHTEDNGDTYLWLGDTFYIDQYHLQGYDWVAGYTRSQNTLSNCGIWVQLGRLREAAIKSAIAGGESAEKAFSAYSSVDYEEMIAEGVDLDGYDSANAKDTYKEHTYGIVGPRTTDQSKPVTTTKRVTGHVGDEFTTSEVFDTNIVYMVTTQERQTDWFNVGSHASDNGYRGWFYWINDYYKLNNHEDQLEYLEIYEDKNGEIRLDLDEMGAGGNGELDDFWDSVQGLYTKRNSVIKQYMLDNQETLEDSGVGFADTAGWMQHIQLRMYSTVETVINGEAYSGKLELLYNDEAPSVSWNINPSVIGFVTGDEPLTKGSAVLAKDNEQETKQYEFGFYINPDYAFDPDYVQITVSIKATGTLYGENYDEETNPDDYYEFTKENPLTYTMTLTEAQLREAYDDCPNSEGYDVAINISDAAKIDIESSSQFTMYKIWDDDSNAYGSRTGVQYVVVNLERSEDGIDWEDVPVTSVDTDGVKHETEGTTMRFEIPYEDSDSWSLTVTSEQINMTYEDEEGDTQNFQFRIKPGSEIIYPSASGGFTYTGTYDGLTVTNTIDQEVITIEGVKEWLDADGNRIAYDDPSLPSSVIIAVFQDDQFYEKLEVTAETYWAFEFDNLPQYKDSSEEYKYTLYELASDGTRVGTGDEILLGNNWYVVSIGDSVSSGSTTVYEVTNQVVTLSLPVTGGTGTWIFTVAGVCLIGGAAAALVYRKRRAVRS